MDEGMLSFIITVGVILLLIYLYKWGPETNKRKIDNFLVSIDMLRPGMTQDQVISFLPFKPTQEYVDLLVYDIQKTTQASIDGHRANFTKTGLYFEITFIDNEISEIYFFKAGRKVLYKAFKI